MTRQFDVALNPDAVRRRAAPYLVVLQSHLLYGMPTIVVAPLRRADLVERIADLQPEVTLDGEPYAIMVAEMAHIPARLLGKSTGNLANYEDAIRRALSRLFTGF